MATLSIPEQGRVLHDAAEIRAHLATIGIDYERWDLLPGIGADSGSDEILAAYADQIRQVMGRGNYTTVDVIDVKPSTPGLDTMLAKFNREHWHDEDEVRFTLHGRGLFHIHPANAPVVAIEVGPGDMIRVPRGTLHWFNLCGDREIKAVRFFQDPAGWTPHYTESAVDSNYEPVCLGPAYTGPSITAA
jgi:1,2-dihydroxy-3-keto-5-methylthiopentene dioxygenase